MENSKNNIQLLLEEYRALRDELLRCNENAQGILNWSYPVLVTLFLAGLYSIPNINQPIIVLGYYTLFVPICILSLATVWFGEIVRQQRVERYLFKLESRINGETSDNDKYKDKLHWHHWLRKASDDPLEGFQFSHYRNIATGYLLFALFSEIISVILILQMPYPNNLKYAILIAPILVLITIVWWFNYQANKYFKFGVFSSSPKI